MRAKAAPLWKRTKREYSIEMRFSELNITSNFTFLKGGSSPEEYAQLAALMGLENIAIADENSVAGIIRAYSELKEIYHQVDKRKKIDHEYGRIGPAAMTNAAPNTAATGSTIADTCPHRKLALLERPSRRRGRDTAAPSGKF